MVILNRRIVVAMRIGAPKKLDSIRALVKIGASLLRGVTTFSQKKEERARAAQDLVRL